MSSVMDITLSFTPAPEYWGKNALLSFHEKNATLHISEDEQEQLQQLQQAARQLDNQGLKSLRVVGDAWNSERLWAFYQGYYNAKQDNALDCSLVDSVELAVFEKLRRAIDWTRQVINQGPAEIYPESLCLSALELLTSLAPNAISHKLIMGEALNEQGWVGCYQVGKGSERAPAMLVVDYNPSGDAQAEVVTALVGKGITFDSGGYSIKPSDGMSVMKSDMGGAATVAGALALAIARGLDKRVILILCCAENLISGAAYKLGDVIRYKNGVSVEVLNTDAEGRLVLADGLILASSYEPRYIIDAATLTGAAKFALGRDYNALFGFNSSLSVQALQAASLENEKLWQLPLENFHLKQIGSQCADIANIGAGEGTAGASTAAAFLAHFIDREKQAWLHFDLSGSFQKSANTHWASGAKGHGVRTVARLLSDLS